MLEHESRTDQKVGWAHEERKNNEKIEWVLHDDVLRGLL